MHINTISDFRAAIRNGPYAWPGGYPLFFLCADGEVLSFEAARENRRLILEAIAYPEYRGTDWHVVACDVNWEDCDMVCAHTYKPIECAYAQD
jgi:hypothetical protein